MRLTADEKMTLISALEGQRELYERRAIRSTGHLKELYSVNLTKTNILLGKIKRAEKKTVLFNNAGQDKTWQIQINNVL